MSTKALIDNNGVINGDVYATMIGAIADAMKPMAQCERATSELAEAVNEASAAKNMSRVDVMRDCANIAIRYDLPAAMVDSVAAESAKAMKLNDDKLIKTMVTFSGQLKNAMHPKVRTRFDTLVGMVKDVWEAEKIEKKLARGGNVKLPATDAWKREYHAINAVLLAVKEDKWGFWGPSDVTAYAVTLDPDMLPEKVHARLTKMAEDLKAIFDVWQDKNLGAAHSQIAGVTLVDLQNLEKLRNAAIEAARVAMTATVAEPISTVEIEPTPDVVTMQTIDASAFGQGGSSAIDLDEVINAPAPQPAAPIAAPIATVDAAPAPRKGKGATNKSKGKGATNNMGAVHAAA